MLDALVETGPTGTAIPENIFRNLGVIPTGQRRFRLADESLVTHPIGQAKENLIGRNLVVLAGFTSDGTLPLQASPTLEMFEFAVNPVTK